MRDWDKTVDELRKNIEDARKRWVLPYLDPTQFDTNTSKNNSKINAEEQNISTNEVFDTEKVATKDPQVVSSKETEEAPAEEVPKMDMAQVDATLDEAKSEEVESVDVGDERVEKVQKVDATQVDAMLDEVKSEEAPAEEVPKMDMAQVDATLDEAKSEEVESVDVGDERVEKVQKVDATQVDAMLDEVKSEEAPAEVKEEKAEDVPKVDATQVDAMLDKVKSEEASAEVVKGEKVKEEKQEVQPPVVKENKPIEKPKRGKKKVKEVKPDYVLLELAELEAINEDDLSEEQEDRLMELRRIKTQRAMHVEDDEKFQSEMKQADEEIKTLKSQLKIKDPLPKGYIE